MMIILIIIILILIVFLINQNELKLEMFTNDPENNYYHFDNHIYPIQFYPFETLDNLL